MKHILNLNYLFSVLRAWFNADLVLLYRVFGIFIFILIFSFAGIAQDVENILKGKKIGVSGSFSANNVNYSAMGTSRNRDAHTYYLSGNVNVTLMEEWSIPLSFTYSNQNVDLSHGVSFNRIGITPTYKWVKLYAGYSSMNFSSYSLSGHSFLGVGLELKPPGKFSLSLMLGRLRKAEEPISEDKESMFSYKRMGYGAKLGFRNKGDELNLIIFGAKDDENSVKLIPKNTETTPMENLVLGFSFRKALYDKLFIAAEYTGSMLTRDKRLYKESYNNQGIFKLSQALMASNASSSIYKAFKTDITYRNNDFSLGLLYERVDPDYQTLGAYYFTNDMENVSLTASKQFFKGHLNISANTGLQRNDLNKEKQSSMKNFVGSLNLNLQAGPLTNISLSYSNYSSFSNIRSNFEDINAVNQQQVYDTLDFTQISQNLSLSISHVLGKIKDSNLRQNININCNVQLASEKQDGKKVNGGTHFYSSSLSHSLVWKSSRISLTSTLNSNYNEMETTSSLTIGPSLSISKTFKKKIRNSLSGSWNKSYQDSKQINRVMVFRYNCSYAINKHSFSLGMNYMNREDELEFADFTLSLGYNYSF